MMLTPQLVHLHMVLLKAIHFRDKVQIVRQIGRTLNQINLLKIFHMNLMEDEGTLFLDTTPINSQPEKKTMDLFLTTNQITPFQKMFETINDFNTVIFIKGALFQRQLLISYNLRCPYLKIIK